MAFSRGKFHSHPGNSLSVIEAMGTNDDIATSFCCTKELLGPETSLAENRSFPFRQIDM